MKYIVIDMNKKDGVGDLFNDEFETAEEAIKAAKWKWSYLTSREKEERKIIVLDSIDPDEESEHHFDGDVILTLE